MISRYLIILIAIFMIYLNYRQPALYCKVGFDGRTPLEFSRNATTYTAFSNSRVFLTNTTSTIATQDGVVTWDVYAHTFNGTGIKYTLRLTNTFNDTVSLITAGTQCVWDGLRFNDTVITRFGGILTVTLKERPEVIPTAGLEYTFTFQTNISSTLEVHVNSVTVAHDTHIKMRVLDQYDAHVESPQAVLFENVRMAGKTPILSWLWRKKRDVSNLISNFKVLYFDP